MGMPSISARLKIKQEGQTAGFGPCFHLPGQPILVFRFVEPQPFGRRFPIQKNLFRRVPISGGTHLEAIP